MRANLKGVQGGGGGGFGPIPAGEYLFKVIEVEDKATQVRLKFVGMDGAAKGRWVWDSLFQTPKALPRLRDAAEAMGVDFDDDEVDLCEETLLDKLVYLTVADDEYEGRKRSKVAYDGYRAYEGAEQAAEIKAKVTKAVAAGAARRAAQQEEAPF